MTDEKATNNLKSLQSIFIFLFSAGQDPAQKTKGFRTALIWLLVAMMFFETFWAQYFQ